MQRARRHRLGCSRTPRQAGARDPLRQDARIELVARLASRPRHRRAPSHRNARLRSVDDEVRPAARRATDRTSLAHGDAANSPRRRERRQRAAHHCARFSSARSNSRSRHSERRRQVWNVHVPRATRRHLGLRDADSSRVRCEHVELPTTRASNRLLRRRIARRARVARPLSARCTY